MRRSMRFVAVPLSALAWATACQPAVEQAVVLSGAHVTTESYSGAEKQGDGGELDVGCSADGWPEGSFLITNPGPLGTVVSAEDVEDGLLVDGMPVTLEPAASATVTFRVNSGGASHSVVISSSAITDEYSRAWGLTLHVDSQGHDDEDADGYCFYFGCAEPVPGECHGDGLVTPADCDDTDATVFPGADEVPDNGQDDDCDGQIDGP